MSLNLHHALRESSETLHQLSSWPDGVMQRTFGLLDLITAGVRTSSAVLQGFSLRVLPSSSTTRSWEVEQLNISLGVTARERLQRVDASNYLLDPVQVLQLPERKVSSILLQVYSGRLSTGMDWAPENGGWSAEIPFQTPFTYNGAPLLLEISTQGSTLVGTTLSGTL